MVGILLVSHRRLAEALISSAQSLVGNLQGIKGGHFGSFRKKGSKREEAIRERVKKRRVFP